MIICKASCPYNTADFICGNPLVVVDENGMCSHLWRHGQPRPPYIVNECSDKQERSVVEGEVRDVEEL